MNKVKHIKHILIIVVLLLVSVSFIKSTVDVLKSKKRLEDLKKEVISMEDKKNKLIEDIEYKKTNDYIEERARNELNLVKEGEKVYVVSDDVKEQKEEKPQSLSIGSSNVLSSKDNKSNINNKNWYMWYKLFF